MPHRIALVGLGNAAQTIHLPALKKLRQVEVVGGCEVRPLERPAPFPVFASVAEMLAAVTPDLVVVATPPSSHFEVVRLALERGCHVFCEKPLAETVEQALALADIARRAGRHVFVNSEFPWMPIHTAAKAAMGQPGFGRLQFLSMHQTFLVTPDSEKGWRGDDLQRTFKEFGTHVLDLATYFFDEAPRAVRARMPKPAGHNTPDLLSIVELEFSGDRYAHILLDRLSKGRHRYLDIRLNGDHATIETSVGGRAQATVGLNAKTRRPFVDLDVAAGGTAHIFHGERSRRLATAPLDLFADATARLLSEALAAIEAGRTPPNGLAQATRTLEMLFAAYASDGQRIAFDG